MRFLDRKEELARLLRLSTERNGGFAAIWGRRRIGKSALLQEWCRRTNGLYVVADETVAVAQREELASVIGTRFPGFGEVRYPSWKTLFDALSRQAAAADWHGPFALDEFPYLVEADASLPSVFQNWLDGEKRRGGIVTAIAGSSQHMMHGLVMEADSPLYGRADEKIRLAPIGIGFISEALHLANPLDAVMAYAVWGGVPRYWVAAERYGKELETCLDDLVLNPLGIFHEEPTTLLQSEIPSAASLKPYLNVIGSGVNRVSEIAGRLELPATALSRPLARLVDLGLVRREIPFGDSEKGSRKSVYKLADPFCRFWFYVLSARRTIFADAPGKVRRAVWRTQADQVFAFTWEELCRRFVATSVRLAQLAGEGDFWLPAGRWWRGSEREWDVVSRNGSNSKVLLGEVKWSQKPFEKREVTRLCQELLRRSVPEGLHGERTFVLFLPLITKDVMPTDDVVLITAEELLGNHCSGNKLH